MQTVKALYQYSTKTMSKLFLLALLVTFSTVSSANAPLSVDDLMQDGLLKVSVNLKEQSQIVPRQQAILEIELISYHDFSDNMKIDFFDIENAIVSKPFARTGFKTKTIKGKQWYIQTKEVALYPLKEGEYNVAPIATEAFINIEGNVVSGKIQTQAYTFNITQTEKLKQVKGYIASSKLDVVREITEQPEQALAIGSAITIKREIHGDNLHGVMLPDFEPIQFDGAQTYEKPTNKSDGYDVLSDISQTRLTSSVTLIFQQEGLYKLPAETVLWWDTTKKRLKTVTMPEMSFQVGESSEEIIANAPQKAESQPQTSTSTINWWLVIVICTALLFLLAIIKVIRQNKQVITAHFNQRIHFKALVNRYLYAIEQSEHQVALACLYQIADIKHNNKPALKALIQNDKEQATLQLLFTLAYDKKQMTDSVSKQSAKALLQTIIDKKFETHFFTPVKFNMKLN
ncbi:hypothetical protein RI845_08885 [Thalassotalea nanhaiensis]|uniref:Protein BatD n=1 Tax=Thalassotalea nanhaiensis TaxID=3065648 RepID=A0ABY9TNU9_9GAMM|nr:hypothetical protein RI845_08885 [Colwelliaceae bacterium SQ345]